MRIKYTLKTAYASLSAHKSRSILTIVGIVIGVTSIMVIVFVGSGAERLIVGEITSLGADIIWIEPGREPEGPTDIAGAILSNTLKDKDIDALRKKINVPGIADIAPAVQVPGSVSYGGETYRPLMLGFSGEFMGRVFDLYPEEGEYFGTDAIRNREKVAVIGARVREELFGDAPALGENIKIKDRNFRVVGVLPAAGQIFFFDVGEIVVVPYSTARTDLLGIDYYNEVWVRVEDPAAIPAVVRDIERTLRDQHGITDPEKDDFYILTPDNLLDQVGSILTILTAALISIVAIALVVGGVGVMNIMLVSVTERTREIGLRKALGATEQSIVGQFLLEAVILTGVGGVIGILLGGVFSFLIANAITYYAGFSWPYVFPFSAALLGFAVSAAVGIIFGIYPARQAAKKSPIEALRYE